ncbi:SCO2400 family protein [Streptomyces sp. XC 2026]|uniref:SCO2400 family protein n=1 Tax=Streptomyces sp. XC 2026 TaxID=2782004 RepID=UPI003FA37A77
MDYCITCRRHLNGALTCPGCGEVTSWQQPHQDPPASPMAVGGRGSDHTTPGGHSGSAPGSGSRGRRVPEDGHDGGDDPPRPGQPDDSPAPPPAGGGRAERRGKRHASRPRKGRRYVLGAVLGIVAVGVLVAEVGEVRLPLQREQPADSGRATDAASESSGTEEDGETTDDAAGGGDTAAGPSGDATATAGESGSPSEGDDGDAAGRDEDDPDADEDEDARDGDEESAGESPSPDASSSGRVSPPPSNTGAPTEGASPDPTETAPGEEEPSSPPPPDDSAGGGDGGGDDGDNGDNGGGGSCWLWWCS